MKAHCLILNLLTIILLKTMPAHAAELEIKTLDYKTVKEKSENLALSLNNKFECQYADQTDFQEDTLGPGNLNTVSGNSELSIGLARDGMLTVFRYPSPSYYDHIKYITPWNQEACKLRMKPYNGAPSDHGQYFYLSYKKNQKEIHQRLNLQNYYIYQHYQKDIIITHYWAKDQSHYILLKDFVHPKKNIYIRKIKLIEKNQIDSPVLSLYSNFNPSLTKYSHLPFQDILFEGQNDFAVRMAFNTLTHYKIQNNKKIYITINPNINSEINLYKENQFQDKLHLLQKNTPSKIKAANFSLIKTPFEKEITYSISASFKDEYFDLPPESEKTYIKHWSKIEKKINLPKTKNEKILQVSKRAIKNILIGQDKNTHGIIASLASQPTYFLAWPRDMAFIAIALDEAGFTKESTNSLLFLKNAARNCQKNPDWVCDLHWFWSLFYDWPKLDGTFDMHYYADYQTGGSIFYEIDNTALTHWIWWEHTKYLSQDEKIKFLNQIYPTMKRGIKTLARCIDPKNNLQCTAFEDDKPIPRQTIHGANTVHLALLSYLRVHDALSKKRDTFYQEVKNRSEQLKKAIYHQLVPKFSDKLNPTQYGQIAWALWPGEVFKDDKELRCELMDKLYNNVIPHLSLKSKGARYIGKVLISLLKQEEELLNKCIDQSELSMKEAIENLLVKISTPYTHQYGEAFMISKKQADGEIFIKNRSALPHIWQGSLNYLLAKYYYF